MFLLILCFVYKRHAQAWHKRLLSYYVLFVLVAFPDILFICSMLNFGKTNNIKRRKLAVSGHVFMTGTPEHLIRAHVSELAAQRGVPTRDRHGIRWQMKSLLPRKAKSRLRQYEVAVSMSRHPDDPEVFCDISQNLGFGSVGSCVPTLTRGNKIWSLCHQRLMLPVERFEAMGIPAVLPEVTVGLEQPFRQALQTFGAVQIGELTGNSMQVAAIGAVMLYVLAFTEYVDDRHAA